MSSMLSTPYTSAIIHKSICLFFLCVCFGPANSYGVDKIDFWNNRPQRGTNFMNEVPAEEWFQDAKNINIKWARLVYDKWETGQRDFLLGNADNYQGLVQEDLIILKQVLAWADLYQLKIVISPLSLPGCRWAQNNNNRYDSRLWENYQYWDMAFRFWADLA
jgi:hypothetical protein